MPTKEQNLVGSLPVTRCYAQGTTGALQAQVLKLSHPCCKHGPLSLEDLRNLLSDLILNPRDLSAFP